MSPRLPARDDAAIENELRHLLEGWRYEAAKSLRLMHGRRARLTDSELYPELDQFEVRWTTVAIDRQQRLLAAITDARLALDEPAATSVAMHAALMVGVLVGHDQAAIAERQMKLKLRQQAPEVESRRRAYNGRKSAGEARRGAVKVAFTRQPTEDDAGEEVSSERLYQLVRETHERRPAATYTEVCRWIANKVALSSRTVRRRAKSLQWVTPSKKQ